jgi:hypothetical protein
MRSPRRLALGAGALLVVVVLAYLVGYRVSLPRPVAAPAADASASTVALTYLAAYNHRDFRLAEELYPSRGGYSRVRPMGHYDDVHPTQLLAEDPEGSVRTITDEQDQLLVWVMVGYTARGFADSDLYVQEGPGGTGFKLSRGGPGQPWRIIDSGTP